MNSIFGSIGKTDQQEFGTFVHACFEKIGWLDEGLPTKKELLEHQASFGPLHDSADDFMAKFDAMLKHPDVVCILSRQSYLQSFASAKMKDTEIIFDAIRVEYANERAFATIVDGQLMQGIIDRLVTIYVGDQLIAANVIDFKTDDVPRGGIDVRTEFYRPQLEAYRKAVSEFTGLSIEKIAAHLVFAQPGIVVDLDKKPNITIPAKEAKPKRSKSKNSKPKSEMAKPKQPKIKSPKFNDAKQMKLWTDD